MTAAEVRLPEINPNHSIVQSSKQSDFLDDSREGGGEWRQQPVQIDTSQDTTQDYDVSDRQGGNVQEEAVEGPQQAAGTLLSRYDVDKFRKSFLNIIYVAMLEEGYHRSYTELFNLVESQVRRKEEAGPNSFIWFQPLLKDNRQHLETLSYFLCRCEDAERHGNIHRMYAERLMLAEYFREMGDQRELATHFFRSCLKISNDVIDEGLTHAQANCNMGDDVFSRGSTKEALEYYDNYYSLTRDQPWTNGDGVSLVQDACVKLLQVYSKMGDDSLEAGESKTAVTFYRKAQELAISTGLIEHEANTSLKLANSLCVIASFTEAIKNFENYHEKCKQLKDHQGAGKAIHHIARSLMKLGRKDEALMQLTQHANEAKHQGILTSYSEACSTLAELYNNKGDFVKASEYSQESFKTLRDIGATKSDSFDSIMAQFGICQGHKFGGQLLLLMEQQSQESVEQLIFWKNSRTLPPSSALSRNTTSLEGDVDEQMEDAAPSEGPGDTKMEIENAGNNSHEHVTDESVNLGNSSNSVS